MSSITKKTIVDEEQRLSFLNEEQNRVEKSIAEKKIIEQNLDDGLVVKAEKLASLQAEIDKNIDNNLVICGGIETSKQQKDDAVSELKKVLDEIDRAEQYLTECNCNVMDAKKMALDIDNSNKQKLLEVKNALDGLTKAETTLNEKKVDCDARETAIKGQEHLISLKEKTLTARENKVIADETRLNQKEVSLANQNKLNSARTKELEDKETRLTNKERNLDELSKALYNRNTESIDKKFAERESDNQRKERDVSIREQDLFKREREYLMKDEEQKIKERILKMRERAVGVN